MKIEENLKLSQKKAKADAEKKAQQEKIRKAEERRKELEEKQKQAALHKNDNKKTVDLNQLYGGIDGVPADEFV